MRLFNENEVIEVLKQTGIIQDNDLGHCVIAEINRIPTAYDVGAVVKRLNAIKDTDVCEKLNCDVCLYSKKCSATTDQSFNLKWDRIVEIVKGGGVDAKTDS